MVEKFRNFIAGEWVESSAGNWIEVENPANRSEIVGLVPRSNQKDVEDAVAAASKAYETWRLVPAPKRAEILYHTGEILAQRKEDDAQWMTKENGKILKETRGDIQEAIDTAYYAAGEGRRLCGETVPVELPNKFGMSMRMPIGVCGIITPWNFPMAIAAWNIFPALIAGNTCVLKPSELTPISANHLALALEKAGLPKGVLNVLHGYGPEAGQPLAEHPKVRVIAFTGSRKVGQLMGELCGGSLKRLCLELGGKNGQIVMDDADLDLAVEGALWGAFGTTGQRCTATSRLIVHEKVLSEFTEKLSHRASQIRIGNGLNARVEMGPLITEEARKKVDNYVKIGVDEGATCILGGEAAKGGELDQGYFYSPTIFTNVTAHMRIAQEEIFGPVVAIMRIASLEEAIQVFNDTDYGLSSAIYTRDVNAAFHAIRDIEAGITYVNGPTIGAEVQLPFGGVKNTGNGHREAGKTVLDIYTEWKSVYVDFSGKLQKAQIDN